VAAIKDADQIIVLDEGKVVARGTHEELLAQPGTYQDLYKSQLDVEAVKQHGAVG
jgi:ATP-binding cassette subfamily B protein